MGWRSALVAALTVVAAAVAATPVASAPAGTVTSIPLKTGGTPNMVVTGPDGNLWVAVGGAVSGIARVTTSGVVKFFPTPTANAEPNYIAVGDDGALWFAEGNVAQIGRITTTGAITERPLPAIAQSLAAGFDGATWVAMPSPGQVGRVGPTGVQTFSAPGSRANIITRGPDNALWFTENGVNRIARITSAGTITEFPVPNKPANIVTGRDGALWFTQFGAVTIGHMTTAGVVNQFTTPSGGGATSITLGPDGLIWYDLFGKVGRMDVGGQVAEFPAGSGGPLGHLGAGPDGAVYAPDSNNDALLRVDPGSPDPILGKAFTAAPVSGTVPVMPPGSKTFTALTPGESLPVGTIVDARHGRVRLFAASGGKTYSADFYEGEFQIEQLATRGATADLKLFGGSFKGCPRGVRPAKSRSIRHLWGEGSGRFRTIGRFSSAAVRGTTWLTDDECSGTLTKVTIGAVTVRDFVKHRNVVVRAGHQYFAAAKK